MYITDDGIRLHVKLELPENHPSKCPLVIVFHGFTGHMEEDHILALSRTFNDLGAATLRVDLYGHGGSDGKFKDHTLLKWMTNALTVIDFARKLDFVTDIYLCGHSQGGLLVMLAAAMKSDVIKAIMPISPAWMIPEGARRGKLLGIPFDPVHIPEELSGWHEELTLGGNYIRTAQMIYVEPAIEAFEGPVLIVHGDADETVPFVYGVAAANRYKKAKLVGIPGDTHCYDNHLDQMTAAVRDWFGEMIGS